MALLAERLVADELMDDPTLPVAEYTAVLHDLAKVNRVTMAYRPTLAFIRRAVGDRKQISILDVGFGDGDMLRRIARFASARGIEARLVGIDLNRNSVAAAREATASALPITYLHGDYADHADEGWDCVISSLVAHHMTPEQLLAFVEFMDAQARVGWFVNDLHRRGLPYLSFPILAAALGWHPIVRHDGQMSIARSYRPAEWQPILRQAGVEGARVFRAFHFRLCVEKLR